MATRTPVRYEFFHQLEAAIPSELSGTLAAHVATASELSDDLLEQMSSTGAADSLTLWMLACLLHGRDGRPDLHLRWVEGSEAPLAPWVAAWLLVESPRDRDALRRVFGARLCRPLIAQATHRQLDPHGRATLYAELVKVSAPKRRGSLAPEVRAFFAAGLTDSAAKVRTACIQGLRHAPQAAATVDDPPPQVGSGDAATLERALLQLRGGDDRGALLSLLARWREVRSPELADVIDLLSARLTRAPLPAIRSRSEAEARWHALAQAGDPAELGHLLGGDWPTQKLAARERVAALAKLRPDPRISGELTRLLRLKLYPWVTPLWRSGLAQLLALRDVRCVEAVRAQLSTDNAISRLLVANHGLLAFLDAPTPTLDACDADTLEELRGCFADAVADGRTADDLVRQIYADPDDDGLRRVFADWLSERGDPRGEFINLQCDRAAGRSTPETRKREAALLHAHAAAWLGDLAPAVYKKGLAFERGFLSACVIRKVKGAVDQPGLTTVHTLEVAGNAPREQLVALLGRLRALRTLSGWSNLLEALLERGCPTLEELRVIELNGSRELLDAPDLHARLPRLRRLGTLTGDAHRWVQGSAAWRVVPEWEVQGEPGQLEGWRTAFAASPWITAIDQQIFGWALRLHRVDGRAALRARWEDVAWGDPALRLLDLLQRLPDGALDAVEVVDTRPIYARPEQLAALTQEAERVAPGGLSAPWTR